MPKGYESFAATLLKKDASHSRMSKLVQVTRGTAALPADIERQFARAQGREMSAEERKFFGLSLHRRERERASLELKDDSRAA